MANDQLIGNTISIMMNLSFAVVALTSVFFVLAWYAWKKGKGKSVAVALGVVVAGVVYEALVSTSFYATVFSESSQGFFLNLIIYGALLFLITSLLCKFIHGSFSHEPSRKIVQVGVFAAVTEGLLFTQAYQILDIESYQDLSSFVDFLFGSNCSMLVWLGMLFVGLFVIHRSR